MSKMSLIAGTWPAKVVDYGMTKSSEASGGNLQVFAELAVSIKSIDPADPSGPLVEHVHNLTWLGHMKSEAGQKVAFKALMAMGLDSVEAFGKLADGPASGALNTEKQVLAVIDEEEYQGKWSWKIKFINDPEDGFTIKRLSRGESVKAAMDGGVLGNLGQYLLENKKGKTGTQGVSMPKDKQGKDIAL